MPIQFQLRQHRESAGLHTEASTGTFARERTLLTALPAHIRFRQGIINIKPHYTTKGLKTKPDFAFRRIDGIIEQPAEDGRTFRIGEQNCGQNGL